MDNFGNKKGYNNSSGLLYTVQGLSSVQGNKPQFPSNKLHEPLYRNDTNMKFFKEYTRDGKKPKMSGVKRLSMKNLETEGGDVRNEDYNNI
jgi:hypothetical protein